MIAAVAALADAVAALEPSEPARRGKTSHPKGWEPGFEWDGSKGTVNTGPLSDRPKTWDAYLIDSGLDPAEVEVIEPVQVRGWDSPIAAKQGGGVARMHYYRLNVRRKAVSQLPDLVSLFKLARTSRKAKVPAATETVETATVALWADPQTGKVASRGGTPDLIERVEKYLAGLDDYSRKHRNDAAYLLDLGDAVEGFENTAQQGFTNDLSLPAQVELATSLLLEAVKRLAATHSRVVLAGVGSNHCRWRRGKEALGKPGDDWGIHMLRQIDKALRLAGDAYAHVTVRIPDDWEETLALDVAGTIIGLAHGHQANKPDLIPDWWAKQTHGGQPVAHADILVTGHYHALRVQPTGRSPHSNRAKWLIQAPTMDNGSDWYRYRQGSDSDPGLAVFTVTQHGWDDLKLIQ